MAAMSAHHTVHTGFEGFAALAYLVGCDGRNGGAIGSPIQRWCCDPVTMQTTRVPFR
jgi:hypothetical protein